MEANWEDQLLSLAFQANLASPNWSMRVEENQGRLRQAYQLAAEITAQHSKSFYFASAFLPSDKRSAVRALYAFCRTVDDIVDIEDQDQNPVNPCSGGDTLSKIPPLN